MITPESSEHATGRLEHPKTEEVEVYFNHNLMKMRKTLQQEVEKLP